MAPVTIAVEDPDQPDVVRLLSESDAYFAGFYPPNSNHLLDVSALLQPGIIFCAAREAGNLLGTGPLAVRSADPPTLKASAGEMWPLKSAGALAKAEWGEIKRMYVVPEARRRGLGRIIFEFLEQLARAEGLRVLRLETGICQADALRLYRSAGFRDIEAFDGYEPDPNSLFMEKRL